MKTLLFSILLTLSATLSWAQNNKNTFYIDDPNYSDQIKMTISTDQTALIETLKDKLTVPVEIKGNKVYLKNKEDNQRILNKLNIPTNEIAATYGNDEGLLDLELLLTQANNNAGRNLSIKNASLMSEQEELVNPDTAIGEQIESNNSSSFMWYIILPVIGIAVGFALGKLMQPKPAPIQEIEVDEETHIEINTIKNNAPTPVQERKTKTNVTINQLKTKYEKLQADSKVLKQNFTDLKQNHKELKVAMDADLQYYKAAYSEIIAPLQNALDKGNLTEIFKYMSIASIQYAAISRAKLTKKQNYDITNINTLLKNPSDHSNYPVISSDTPIDKTPQQLQQVVSVLKQLGVKDLDNYILQGYKLNNL